MADEVPRRGSAEITFENPGDLLVEIIRNMFSRGASMVVSVMLEKIFSGDRTIEEILWDINQRGLEIKIQVIMEIPGHTGEKGEIDPPIRLAEEAQQLTVSPGMLQTAEVEPAQVAVDRADDPKTVH